MKCHAPPSALQHAKSLFKGTLSSWIRMEKSETFERVFVIQYLLLKNVIEL